VQLQGLVPLKKTELLGDNYSQVIYKTMVVPEQQLLIQYWLITEILLQCS